MAKPEKTAKPAKDLSALKSRIEAILHSNGFDGSKAAGEITDAVGGHLGADLSTEQKAAEETEE